MSQLEIWFEDTVFVMCVFFFARQHCKHPLNECGKNNIQVWDLEIGIVSYLNIRYQNRSETMKFHELGEGVVMLAVWVVKLKKGSMVTFVFCVFLSLKKKQGLFLKVGF